ncbi:MAG: hypothetical protein EBR34_14515 [Sphingomonadaceae bacterium]|nr:hypothetical protein [Sphingomonadaceae bacterium]
MTELRSLLFSMSSHMAYMQGQLEAQHQFDDPEDYYWYRESEALRAKVEAALASGGTPNLAETRSSPQPPSGEVAESVADLHALILRMADKLDHYSQLLSDNRLMEDQLAIEARAALPSWEVQA